MPRPSPVTTWLQQLRRGDTAATPRWGSAPTPTSSTGRNPTSLHVTSHYARRPDLVWNAFPTTQLLCGDLPNLADAPFDDLVPNPLDSARTGADGDNRWRGTVGFGDGKRGRSCRLQKGGKEGLRRQRTEEAAVAFAVQPRQ
jgi:hypothetical protein